MNPDLEDDGSRSFFDSSVVIGWLVIEKKYHINCYHSVVIGMFVIEKKYHKNIYHKIKLNFQSP